MCDFTWRFVASHRSELRVRINSSRRGDKGPHRILLTLIHF